MNGKINHLDQICSVKKLCYTQGKAKGLNVYLVNNGVLQFEIIVDKCMDIGQLYSKGTNISFLSANGLCSFNSEFENIFNGGMLYTCGLDTVGGRKLPIHGAVHNIPANIISCKCDEEGIEVKGEIYQTSLFGDKFKLIRTISTKANSPTLEISDKITNMGHKEGEYCVLYHTNIGYPMLDEGVEIVAPITSTKARTDYAKSGIKNCLVMDEPQPNNEECVFYHTIQEGDIKVINKKLNKVFRMQFDSNKLPHFIEWKSMVSGAYALGIEPATTTLDDDFVTNKLSPQESKNISIKITVEDLV